jgi:peptide deformylase
MAQLREKNEEIEVFDLKLKKLIRNLFYEMYKLDGIGLAAPQVIHSPFPSSDLAYRWE